MNFGDILDEWDRETAKPYGKKKLTEDSRKERTSCEQTDGDEISGGADRAIGAGAASANPACKKKAPEEQRANPMDVWLRRYGTVNKDSILDSSPETESPAERRRRLHAMRPEATIDLHGLTRDDAWSRLELFFADSVRRGLKKVLIIHGKGTHSAEDPVLRRMVRLFLEQNSHAGESGSSEKDSGGSGSTWVILK